ncbi:MAG: CHAT domain-containing protein [Chitinophagaceae bacterium]
MHKYQLTFLLLLFLFPLFLSGQCPDKKWLWERIIFLKDSSKASPKLQLQELLKYESSMHNCTYQNDSTRILLLQRISGLSGEVSEYIQAIDYIRKAINIISLNPHNSSINRNYQVRNYYSLASMYNSLNKTADKIKAYDSCIAVAVRLKIVNIYFLIALLDKVTYLNDVGEYSRSIIYAKIGETMSYQYIPEKGMDIYGTATQYSLSFVIQHVNALLVLKRSDEAGILLTHKMEECKKRGAIEYLGSFYEQYAMTKMQNKDYKDVISYFNLALKYNRAQKYTLGCKVNIHNIGYCYYEIYKDDTKALFYYKKALEYVNTDPNLNKFDSIISLSIYTSIANVFVRRAKFDSAQYYFQCAFNQIKKGTNETEVLNIPLDDFIQNQKVEYLSSLFIDKADSYYKQIKATNNASAIKEAIRIYKVTDLLLERIKTRQSEMQSKIFWRMGTHRLYDQAIDACITGGKQEDAFYFFEKSRSILLYDQIKEQRWIGENDITKQLELKNKISKIDIELSKADPASKYFTELQSKSLALKQEQDNLIQKIKERNPLYYQSFLDTNFIYLKDVRRHILQNHQALVEIFAGDSTVYAMIITNDNIYFNRINKKAYDSVVNLCISYMSDPVLLNRNNQFNLFAKSSRYLYDLIFQHKKLPDGRIIISPDGRYFPFEALVTGFEGKEPVYFLQNHAVSYTYSARFLMNEFASSKRSSGNFMGVAPVRFPEKLHLSPLLGSDQSVERLQSFFGASEVLIADKATKDNFLEKFGRYQIIQLYTHSSDSSSKGEPEIHFVDQPLYLSDLQSVSQPITKLVVLSACETGIGHFYQGEGVFSFNRAFAALGIPSCITNLWSIDNESTYLLTELFYENLSSGLAIDKALQQAKLTFIKTSPGKGRLPYFWAATILAGKTDAIDFKKKSKASWMIPIVVGVAGIFLLFTIIRKRRK